MIDFTEVSDEDLYRMCCSGDEHAWQYIYKYSALYCKRLGWRTLESGSDDIAQEVAMKLLSGNTLRSVKNPERFRAFVLKISRNKMADTYRSQKFTESVDQPMRGKGGDEFVPQYADPAPSHESVLMDLEVFEVFNAALAKLSANCQRVVKEYINYKLGEHDDFKALSKALGMTVPNISSTVRRCLNKMVEFKEIKALRA